MSAEVEVCPQCKNYVWKERKICPHCQCDWQQNRRTKKRWHWLGWLSFILGLLMAPWLKNL